MDKVNLFRHLVAMAASDGEFKEAEIQMLAVRANQWDITEAQFLSTISDIKEGRLELYMPKEPDAKVELLKNMMHMMAIDGELAEEEKRLCAMASATMGFDEAEFDAILDQLLSEIG